MYKRQILAKNISIEYKDVKINVIDTPGTTVTEIRAKARRMLHNKEKAVIILDYLQLRCV